jgi:hypothetical protein
MAHSVNLRLATCVLCRALLWMGSAGRVLRREQLLTLQLLLLVS